MEQTGSGRERRFADLVGEHVRRLRQDKGWSAREVAERCQAAGAPKLSRGTIAKLESGTRPFVTVGELQAFANVFRVSANDLLLPIRHSEQEAHDSSPLQSGGRFTCPYCYSYFSTRTQTFRCEANLGEYSQCIDTVDERYNYYFGRSKVQRLTFQEAQIPKLSFLQRLQGYRQKPECPNCSSERVREICPECHAPLPNDVDYNNGVVLGFVGPKYSGKSCYLAALIHHLKGRWGEEFELSTTPMDDDTANLTELYTEPFSVGERLAATSSYARSAVFDVSPVRAPAESNIARFYFSLSDRAGEEFATQFDMERNSRYVGNSSCIFFFLNPVALGAKVRTGLRDGSPDYEGPLAPANLLMNLAGAVRLERRLPRSSRVPIPIAVIISMWDLVESADAHHLHLSPSVTDTAERVKIARAMRTFLIDLGHADFLRALEAEFAQFRIFPVSALGRDLTQDTSTSSNFHPAGVMEPMMWTMHNEGLINHSNGRSCSTGAASHYK